mmetsp:Transcript_53516/g.62516  ORF Transcript_53516/g.62516 Transcript_53516/m.62516 type:complete len:235 (+) Transcript_53516:1669-2373(+)
MNAARVSSRSARARDKELEHAISPFDAWLKLDALCLIGNSSFSFTALLAVIVIAAAAVASRRLSHNPIAANSPFLTSCFVNRFAASSFSRAVVSLTILFSASNRRNRSDISLTTIISEFSSIRVTFASHWICSRVYPSFLVKSCISNVSASSLFDVHARATISAIEVIASRTGSLSILIRLSFLPPFEDEDVVPPAPSVNSIPYISDGQIVTYDSLLLLLLLTPLLLVSVLLLL